MEITTQQVSHMKHAIGYSHESVKKGKYTCYRNRFCLYESNESWEQLVTEGYAKVSTTRGYYYWVTQKGLDYLSEILGVTILPEED